MTEVIINKTIAFAKKHHMGVDPSHDWWHVWRVYNLAIHLAKQEDADTYIVSLAALLHDIDDRKLVGEENSKNLFFTQIFLSENNISKKYSKTILEIIRNMSYKGSGVESPMMSIEGKCVQDADRLDAMGAVGIARCMAYTGIVGTEIFNPEIPAIQHQSYEEYKKSKGTAINHFYEKLLLLQDRLNTTTAKKIGEKRHQFMKLYLEHFFEEIREL